MKIKIKSFGIFFCSGMLGLITFGFDLYPKKDLMLYVHLFTIKNWKKWGYWEDWYDGPFYNFDLGPFISIVWRH